ncbi:MAG TPA: prepilin peptidase [Candidatus Atribacteria bacterium]|nr:prepilin peptidase [Candidatus Atribacteria bacterium]
MIGALVFLLGLFIGSFFNVCIYRIPYERSIVFPPSHCPSCSHRLGTLDLIPVFSYLLLKGKCRYCGSRISVQYPLIELLTGGVFLYLYLHFGLTWQLLTSIVLVSLLLIMTVIDIKHMIIPDELVAFGIVSAFIFQIAGISQIGYLSAIYGTLLGGGVFLLIALFSMLVLKKEGMGGGDIKLMAMIGALTGWKATLLSMVLSVYLGGLLGGILLLLKVKRRGDYIPYGPFIAMAAVISLLWGDNIISWWLALF